MSDQHDHHHPQDAEGQPEPIDEEMERLDPGSESLSKALQGSFRVLKGVMALIVVMWAFSGVHRIKQDENAIVLQFGAVKGEGVDRVRGSGILWSWPFPIDEVRTIPAKRDRSTSIDVMFYRRGDRGKREGEPGAQRQELKPVLDGYTLTGDGYILHSDWEISWQIHDPYRFLESVYSESSPQGKLDVSVAIKLLENELCKAVMATTAQYTIMDAVKDKRGSIVADVERTFVRQIDELSMGVTITNLSLAAGGMVVSPVVQPAFNGVLMAEQQRGEELSKAESYATQILATTAGSKELAEKIYKAAIRKREAAGKSKAEADEADKALSTLLRNEASGAVKQRLLGAQLYKRELIEAARGDEGKIRTLAGRFAQHPEVFTARIWMRTVRMIVENVLVEKYVLPSGLKELRLLLNPDVTGRDEIRRAKEAEKRRKQEQALAGGARLY